jgi:ENTS family enterobactin (siderophore) exporter
VRVPRFLVDIGPLRRNHDFRLLYSGQLISLLGSNLTVVAVPFQVYSDTHSSLWVGLASLLQLPFLIGGSLWGGAMGDRRDKRTLMLVSSMFLALLSAGLAINARVDHQLAYVLILAALAAGFAGFSNPLRTAAIPTLVASDELMSAYSLNQVSVNGAAVVGPALAGILIASVGLFSCYMFDAMSFVILTVLTSLIAPLPPSGEHSATKTLRAIGDGFRYVRSHVVAQAIYLVDLNAMVFGLPRALFPAVALTMYHGGPRTLGLLYAAPGAGALVMAVMTGWIVRVHRRGRLVAVVVMAWGGAMALFGIVHLICCATPFCKRLLPTSTEVESRPFKWRWSLAVPASGTSNPVSSPTSPQPSSPLSRAASRAFSAS